MFNLIIYQIDSSVGKNLATDGFPLMVCPGVSSIFGIFTSFLLLPPDLYDFDDLADLAEVLDFDETASSFFLDALPFPLFDLADL